DLNFKQHETRPYSIYLIRNVQNKVDTLRIAWWEIGNRFTVKKSNLKGVGDYTLFVQQTGEFGKFPKNEMTQMNFKIVETPKDQERVYTFYQIFPFGLAILTLLGLFFLSYQWQAKRKLKKAESEREVISNRIGRIRSQLNPHFMFNCINSIQNLIQNCDIDSAKNYLQTFSSLTRDVLEDSEKEMHNLSAELKLIEEYLIMEQLRFGFTYRITVEVNLHPD